MMPVLEVRNISQRYGETQALNGIDVVVRPDEVTGVAGPNGAGKTTLVKILAGEESPDGGEISFGNSSWSSTDPRDLVAVVHQEPKLFPNLTVVENLLVGTQLAGTRRPVATDADRSLLAEFGIDRYADRPLINCSLVTWQLTEIARAMRRDAKIFLFDEPNSALSEDESERLFEHILGLKRRGLIVMLVSHRLQELADLCDRVVIVREGTAAASLNGAALTAEAIAAELVVGHAAQDSGRSAERRGGTSQTPVPSGPAAAAVLNEELVLRVQNWTHHRGAFSDVALDVPRGEVLAIMGVEGSGGRELIRSMADLEPASGIREMAPLHAGAKTDVSYLPSDRRTSLFPNFTVGANLVARLGAPEIATSRGRLLRRAHRSLAQELMRSFRIKTSSPRQPIGALSGGNQQKVAVAASVVTGPQLLLIEEPTRGVDIGTKAEIYGLLWNYASEGNAVVVFCTEIPEVFDLAKRVRVAHLGLLSQPLDVASYPDVTSLAAAVENVTRQQEAAVS